jgi:hypothetical protein
MSAVYIYCESCGTHVEAEPVVLQFTPLDKTGLAWGDLVCPHADCRGVIQTFSSRKPGVLKFSIEEFET